MEWARAKTTPWLRKLNDEVDPSEEEMKVALLHDEGPCPPAPPAPRRAACPHVHTVTPRRPGCRPLTAQQRPQPA